MVSETSTIFLAIATLSAGAFWGVLGSNLVAIKYKTDWVWCFYILAIGSIITAIIEIFFLCSKLEKLDYFTMSALFLFGIGLFFFTYYKLHVKNIFKVSELESVINEWTTLADKSEIRLLGRDLDFFGNTPADMDLNGKYCHLKSLNFSKISILCEKTNDPSTKIRYGKILHELKNVELKFYDPKQADLRIRGRLQKVDGVEKLLIYSKIKKDTYQAMKTDTANIGGALYSNIWNLAWLIAETINKTEIDNFISSYLGEK